MRGKGFCGSDGGFHFVYRAAGDLRKQFAGAGIRYGHPLIGFGFSPFAIYTILFPLNHNSAFLSYSFLTKQPLFCSSNYTLRMFESQYIISYLDLFY